MTLTPAYGRDYKSKKAVLTDWNSNKDFVISDVFNGYGRYVNKPQITNENIVIRYDKQRKVMAL